MLWLYCTNTFYVDKALIMARMNTSSVDLRVSIKELNLNLFLTMRYWYVIVHDTTLFMV